MAKVEYYEGKPIFKANTSKQLAEAVAKFKGEVEAPYVVMVSSTMVKKAAFAKDETVGVALFEEGKVTKICDQAFMDCPALTTVIIPKSVTEIWELAFSGCPSLERIIVTPGNTTFDSREECNAIIRTKRNEIIYGCKATVIPNTVTDIGRLSFCHIKTLTKINIPASVKVIGERAFKWSGLTEIDLPDSIEEIEDQAFACCKGITNVTLPSSVKEIGQHAFDGTSITSITIPNGVKKIYCRAFGIELTGEVVIPRSVVGLRYAFAQCDKLTKVIINAGPDVDLYHTFDSCSFITSVGPIGSGASVELRTPVELDDTFENCTNLTDITMPTEVVETPIEEKPVFKANNSKELAKAVAAFEGETYAPYVVQISAEKVEEKAFEKNDDVGAVILEDNVKEIGADAFHYCNKLTQVIIPEGVTKIGNNAFCLCEALQSIRIPKSVTSIGESAFSLCKKLTSATFADLESLLAIDFEGYSSNPLSCDIDKSASHHLFFDGSEQEVKNIVIPEGTTKIGNYTFDGCSALESVTIPKGVKSLGEGSFKGCSSLSSIVIPDSVKTIGMHAFDGSGLTSVTVPDGVKKIDEGVFENCKSLKSIEIPDSIKSIGLMAFSGCDSLTSVTIPDSVTKIGSDAFIRCRNLRSVTIGDGVKTIGTGAFGDCESLTGVFLGRSVTKIGNYAFCSNHWQGCTPFVIQSLAVPAPVAPWETFGRTTMSEPVLYVPKGAYYGDGGWTYLLSKYILEPDENIYMLAPDIPNVIIPEGTTKIGRNAFMNCKNVTSVEIPDSVAEICENAFKGCEGLKEIHIKDVALLIEAGVDPSVKIITT